MNSLVPPVNDQVCSKPASSLHKTEWYCTVRLANFGNSYRRTLARLRVRVGFTCKVKLAIA